MAINQNKKYVNALFLVGAALVWFISKYYIEVLLGTLNVGRNLGVLWYDILRHGLPVLLGLATFLVFTKHNKIRIFATDAMGELIKVVWPGQKEVRAGTIVVIITVILSGIALGMVDWLFSNIVKLIINA